MKTCARTWQVEATRDGRLRGKDLESAERHRETCRECAEQTRELETLSNAFAGLPVLGRDQVSVQRTRQQLLSAFNQTVLEPRVSRARALLALAGAAALLGSLWFVNARKTARPVATPSAASVVHIQASADAQWTEHLNERLDRIAFAAGSASFSVRPHQGRRVIVSLPDGEIEDLGTVFAVLVQDQTTKRVTVSEGRVSLHLRGHSPIIIGAGESWEAPVTPAKSAEPTAPPAVSAPQSGSPVRKLRAAAAGPVLGSIPPAQAASRKAPIFASLPDEASAKAEDDAYLRIISLLRTDKQDEARVAAKRYLLHFPNAFRRVEVLNIATR